MRAIQEQGSTLLTTHFIGTGTMPDGQVAGAATTTVPANRSAH